MEHVQRQSCWGAKRSWMKEGWEETAGEEGAKVAVRLNF